MSKDEPIIGDASAAAARAAGGGHGDAGGHEAGHAEEPLGPIDVVAWTYAVVGVLLGLVVAGAFAISAGWIGFPV